MPSSSNSEASASIQLIGDARNERREAKEQEGRSEQAGRALVGKSIKRIEDPKFLTGDSTYLDDIRLARMLHGVFVRSTQAHARLIKVDASAAMTLPRVIAVLTGGDLEGKIGLISGAVRGEGGSNGEDDGSGDDGSRGAGDHGGAGGNEEVGKEDGEKAQTAWRPLATGEVNYVGETIALVLAEDPYSAMDGADLVQVEYEPLTVVVDPELALRSNSPKVHDYLQSNLAYRTSISAGNLEEAFTAADHVIKVRLVNQRVHPVPLEPRGIIAEPDATGLALTIYLSTQDPHGVRDELADILNLPRETVRVIAPDVGGGFGGKGGMFPEDAVVAHAARLFRRPVKWVEDRREDLQAMRHGRGQVQFAELALTREGKILGLDVKIISDVGAYSPEYVVAEVTLDMATGVYDIPNYRAELRCALTNKVPDGAYRGAGRPEAAYLIERCVSIAATKLRLDPVKIRQLNYVRKEQFPYKNAAGRTYDTGDYHANLAKALEVANYENLVSERRRAREDDGRLIGIGLVTWVEISGFGPDFPQTASMSVTDEGKVLINIGGQPHGQGHATTFAQIAADELGLAIEDITVRHGDTDLLPWSSITAGSRSGALTGSAVLLCARKIREKMTLIASYRSGATAGARIAFEGGSVYPEGDRSAAVTFQDLASTAYSPEGLPPGMEPTLFSYTAFAPVNNQYPFGTHIAVVEVDQETGFVKLLKYFAVDDCGKVINPMVVEGQVDGGIVQGIGQALIEGIVYDENGQLLTATLSDYLVPSADMIPEIVWERTETPTYANPLGVKGIGEAGTIAATPAIINALDDALSDYGITLESMPACPPYVWGVMRAKGVQPEKKGEEQGR